eukprot:3615373-Rhodomonas_salina.1
MLGRLDTFYRWAGLSINNAKCAVAAHHFGTGKQLAADRLLINDKELPRLGLHQSYKFLGMEVTLGGSWAKEKARVRAKLSEC